MRVPAVVVLLAFVFCPVAFAEWVPLWPDEAPGGAKPPAVTESEQDGGRLTDTAVPAYEVHFPEGSRRTGAAVVVFPGGGYGFLSMRNEGHAVADWLNERGVVAVLVKYRVSRDAAAGFQFPVPLLDARRAIRVTRSQAKEWGVDPGKIGVMGFSAGGHLASMSATMWDEKFLEEGKDAVDMQACRPDFAVLIYPVITMSETWGHGGSKRNLLGDAPTSESVVRVSTEERVNAKTPPCFLVHAADDGAVPARNSLEFAACCAENKVPVVCHVFAQGGHGFGMKGRGDSAAWIDRFGDWLVGMKLADGE